MRFILFLITLLTFLSSTQGGPIESVVGGPTEDLLAAIPDLDDIQDALQIPNLFPAFVHRFNKGYKLGSEEYLTRQKVFVSNVERLLERNKEAKKRGYSLVINGLTDKHQDEMGKMPFAMHSKSYKDKIANLPKFRFNAKKARKQAVQNWRDSECMPAVRHQQRCGSCWAFALINCIEVINCHYNHPGELVELSEQNLVDCGPKSYGITGCEGGDLVGTLNWLKATQYKIATRASYPYTANNSSRCKTDVEHVETVRDFRVIDGYDQEDQVKLMELFLDHYGPITVAFNAPDELLNINPKEIYNPSEEECEKARVEDKGHAVAVVGYGKEDGEAGEDYWLIRNSWGTEFGDKGYFKMRKGANVCGIEFTTVVAPIFF